MDKEQNTAAPRISTESLKQLYQIRESWKKARKRFDSKWADIASKVNPDMADWTSDLPPSRTSREPSPNRLVYDNTAQKASNLFADGLQAYSFGQGQDWLRLVSEDPDDEKDKAATEWLQNASLRVSRGLSRSNFYDEARPFLKSGADFATAIQFRDHDVKRGIAVYKTLHLKRCLIGENQYGENDSLIRDFWLEPWQAAAKFGAKRLPTTIADAYRNNLNRSFKFTQLVFPLDKFNLDIEPRGVAQGKAYYSLYVADVDRFEAIEDGGYEDRAFYTWRWGRCLDGDVWGVDSPGMVELSTIKQLNAERADFSRGSQLGFRPPIKATESMREQGVHLEPNYNHYMRPGMDFAVVPVMGPFEPIAQDMLMLKKSINESYYVDFFLMLSQNLERFKTATEVAGLQGEQSAMIAAMSGRLHFEYLERVAEDSFALELAYGRLPPIPASLKGKKIRVDLISPLSQMQKRYLLLSETDAFVGRILQIAQITQDQTKLDRVDFDAYIGVTAEAYNVDRRIVRDLVEVQRMKLARAKAQADSAAQQQALEAAKAQATVYAASSKAPEAGSPAATLMRGPQG
ncbi:MAG TPA: portal protein [Spirochaetales bacterium]|nr:portal protein [Spirochaetales bacterium]HRY53006.1 portal protein [Spirochaetia bacterium]